MAKEERARRHLEPRRVAVEEAQRAEPRKLEGLAHQVAAEDVAVPAAHARRVEKQGIGGSDASNGGARRSIGGGGTYTLRSWGFMKSVFRKDRCRIHL